MKFGLLFIMVSGLLNFSFASDSVEGIKVGESTPVTSIKSVDGTMIDLTSKDQEFVLVFYRGSWCPYCMTQLKSIQSDLMPKLDEKQVLVAISVDKEKIAKKMKGQFDFKFHVVSDPKAKLLQEFKIANKLSDELVNKYKNSYKIDVEGDSGETHHIVAHPAVYIIKSGKVKYADIHTNYKERTKNEEILKNLKK
ncbi:MAG: redoxin family protein [Bacteriovoracaceae bacterium]|nr:redoxin family protein [Bacteriovoracaceae bacterium]